MSLGLTGYSPLRMWTSVPQIVVSVTRMTASPGPGRGRSTWSTRMSPGPWNTAARICPVINASGRSTTDDSTMLDLLPAAAHNGRLFVLGLRLELGRDVARPAVDVGPISEIAP